MKDLFRRNRLLVIGFIVADVAWLMITLVILPLTTPHLMGWHWLGVVLASILSVIAFEAIGLAIEETSRWLRRWAWRRSGGQGKPPTRSSR